MQNDKTAAALKHPGLAAAASVEHQDIRYLITRLLQSTQQRLFGLIGSNVYLLATIHDQTMQYMQVVDRSKIIADQSKVTSMVIKVIKKMAKEPSKEATPAAKARPKSKASPKLEDCNDIFDDRRVEESEEEAWGNWKAPRSPVSVAEAADSSLDSEANEAYRVFSVKPDMTMK